MLRPKTSAVLWAVLFSFLCTVSGLHAQSGAGTISGTVRDPAGAVVVNATVMVTNTATNVARSVQTNGAGDYTAPNLPVGPYNIRVEQQGFKPALISNITLNAAANVRADFSLELGTAQQTVEVQANAVQLQTEDAKTSVTVTNKLVEELPLVVSGALRSPFDLAVLTPEAKNLGGDYGFILGGGQGAAYNVTLDGVSANDTSAQITSWVATNAPSVEAITEFTVDTNGFKAEYGHSTGGVMTFVSKSGTNEYHGSAYEFLRNNALDANYFFSNKSGVARQVYKQSDFGASFGGPVYIPKIINGKNKTFFFASYEGFRNRVGAIASSATIPTPEMWDGDFRNWVNSAGQQIPIYDPTTQRTDASGNVTRSPFPNNMVPKNLFDPLSVKAMSVFQEGVGVLKPNNGAAPGTVGYVSNNYLITSGSSVTPYNKFSVKGDHVFSEKDRLSGFYGYNRQGMYPGANGPATLPGNFTTFQQLNQASDVFRMTWDHTFRPNLLNHFYAGNNLWRQENVTLNVARGPWKDKICIPNVPNCDENLPQLNWSNGYTQWGAQASNGSENTIYAFHDDLSWIKGKHQFKMGGMFQYNHYNGFGHAVLSGQAIFNFTETGRPGDTNFTTAGGNPFASFLLGWADGGRIDTVRFIAQKWPYYAGYFQDDWRISSKLMLNLGIRWETTLPPHEANDQFSDFSPTLPNPGAGNIPGAIVFAGSGQGRANSSTLADAYYKAFGPHIGFAYTLNPKTVVRGSYALSYGNITTSAGSTHQVGFVQILNFYNNSNGINPTWIFSQGPPPWTKPPFIDPSFANGGTAYWWQNNEATRPPAFSNINFSIQRQISPTLVLETSYNAALGSRLQSYLLNYNQVPSQYLNTLGASLLTQQFDSPAAVAAGITAPFPGFKGLWGSGATVAQALRPFPQYNNIDTWSGGGDHSGHSTYHAAIIRLDKRYSNGLNFQTSYVFAKLLTDSDSYSYYVSMQSADQYNRGLEKSIGQYDVTHSFKLGLIYELPFGIGKHFLSHGPAARILGNWRVSTISTYSSGLPVALSTTVTQPLFAGRKAPYITSYDGWRAPIANGSFDPSVDSFLVPYQTGPFPRQGPGTPYTGIGNATRYNPKVRYFPNLNENLSIAKTFVIHEQFRVDFRAEAFNAFNRVRFGTGSTQLQSQTFGVLTSNSDLLNTPRQLQFALKLYF